MSVIKTKKLERQLKKILGTGDMAMITQCLREALNAHAKKTDQHLASREFVENLEEFFAQVDGSYTHYENLVNLANRSLEVSLKELTDLNLTINTMIDSLGQGFFIFGPDGICLPTYSRACEELLKISPARKHVRDVLRIKQDNEEGFELWMELLFSETHTMPFDAVVALGPKVFSHSQNRYIALEYAAVKNAEGRRTAIVVIATDKTEEVEAKKEALNRELFAEMIIQITRNRDYFLDFVRSLRALIKHLKSSEPKDLVELKRTLHTLKGSAASFSIRSLRDLIHQAEDLVVEQAKKPLIKEEWAFAVRQCAESLNRELNAFLDGRRDLLGEDFERRGEVRSIPIRALYSFAAEMLEYPEGKGLALRFLKDIVATPIFKIFMGYDTLIQSLSQDLDKPMGRLQVIGDDVKVLDEVYREVFTALGHVFRNIMDHGIETPSKRIEHGKGASGQIVVSIQNAANTLNITIADDGSGIDLEALKFAVREKQPNLDLSKCTNEDIYQYIFLDDVSTSRKVTSLSGRGVGMAAVRAAVEKLGGTIRVSSTPHKGTQFTIQLPIIWDIRSFVNSRVA